MRETQVDEQKQKNDKSVVIIMFSDNVTLMGVDERLHSSSYGHRKSCWKLEILLIIFVNLSVQWKELIRHWTQSTVG